MEKRLKQISTTQFILLGLLFATVSGLALIFFAGLECVSMYYPKLRSYLTWCLKALTRSCAYLDKKLAKHTFSAIKNASCCWHFLTS
ncbi:hypothetical protein [Pseudoalteromonas sp.]|uniref:hypothetical protein n=1 Tax=Pseudoalteromonas sp. TaxID=53249 RepID=UPI001BCC2650|nr:hypothetical protein [Pseudoalteromonas sp.]